MVEGHVQLRRAGTQLHAPVHTNPGPWVVLWLGGGLVQLTCDTCEPAGRGARRSFGCPGSPRGNRPRGGRLRGLCFPAPPQPPPDPAASLAPSANQAGSGRGRPGRARHRGSGCSLAAHVAHVQGVPAVDEPRPKWAPSLAHVKRLLKKGWIIKRVQSGPILIRGERAAGTRQTTGPAEGG